MSTAWTTSPGRQRFTRADLEHTPDDGLRYEIIDGELFVSPAPRYRHQRVALLLSMVLENACPDGYIALFAPFAVGLAEDTEVQPDILVARRSDFTEVDLPVAPLLAVEILSPSTQHVDLGIKKGRYERAGIASYWIIDPEGPTVYVHELREGAYEQIAAVQPNEEWTAELPFPVTFKPIDLVD